MIEKDIMPFLSEQEEWKLLAELHPNNVKGAEVWAQMGKFEKAAERLECSQKEHDLEEKELLLSYYLKVQRFVSHAYPIADTLRIHRDVSRIFVANYDCRL